MNNLTPLQLRAFLCLVETGSFSRAATSLGVSQPTVSRIIRAIEDAIGAQLFHRDTRNIQLTPTGRELRLIAIRLVREFDNALSELSFFIGGQRGQIAVASLPSVAVVLLPRAIVRFHETNPDVEVLVRDGLSERVSREVADETAVLGLTVRPTPSSALSYRPLLWDEFCLVCRKDDGLAELKNPTWSVFRERPFVAMSPSSSVRTMTDAAFLQAGFAVKPLYECSHLATTGGLVAAGAGITALPRLALPIASGADLASSTLSDPPLKRSIGLVVHAGRPLTQAGQAFVLAVEAEARRVASRGWTQGL